MALMMATRNTRVLVIFALIAVVAMVSAGCDDQTHDLKGVKFSDVQHAEGFNNVDQHPNIVRFCIDGRAFVSTTREGTGLIRIPEWDVTFCHGPTS